MTASSSKKGAAKAKRAVAKEAERVAREDADRDDGERASGETTTSSSEGDAREASGASEAEAERDREAERDGDASDGDASEGEASEGDASDGDASDEEPSGDEESGAGIVASLEAWLRGGKIPKEAALFIGLVLPAFVLVWNLWRVREFTIDDAYISYRYAKNFARGMGLVYNAGERIEGYTNFLWTVLLGVGIKLGIDPNAQAKVMGGAAALGSMGLTYRLSEKLSPFKTLPCVATWMLASTIVFTGWSVFGLETIGFVFFVLAGTSLFFDEEEVWGLGGARKDKLPISGLLFALAGLTRPEAPAFIGLLMLFLGTRVVAKRNIVRGLLFAGPIAIHMLWRHSYYGAWVPNTLGAKTGNLSGQVGVGWGYVQNYLNMAGPSLWLAVLGFAIGVVRKSRAMLAIGAIAAFVCGYVTLVGGDWMPFFRFMAPFEPFCFLLLDVGARSVVDRKDRASSLAFAAFAAAMFFQRNDALRGAQKQFLEKEKRFWDMAAGGTAAFFEKNNLPPGQFALGDIGEVGYKTDFPILDLLGLVDPVISKLPGGYTQKLGPGFLDRFFSQLPEYSLIISSNLDCQHPSVSGSIALYRDPRYLQSYSLAGKVPLDGGFAWCIYRKKH